jgi:hypothetical protein
MYDRYVVLFFCRSQIPPLAGVVWSMLCSNNGTRLTEGDFEAWGLENRLNPTFRVMVRASAKSTPNVVSYFVTSLLLRSNMEQIFPFAGLNDEHHLSQAQIASSTFPETER